MQYAVQVAIANGAPADVMPVNVAYDIESFGKAGTSLWMIVYSLPLPTDPQKSEMHFYYVDGLTGKFVEAGYKADGSIVEKEKLTIKGPDYSASTVLMDQKSTVVKFFTLVNEGKSEESVTMMDKSLTPDESAQKTWINTLASIRGFNIEFVTEENKDNWSSDMQMFEVDLIVPTNKDLQLYGWMEGNNTRYVTLKRLGNDWLIESFSFQ